MDEPFDPAKDAANREKHGLSLAVGDRIAADDEYLIIPSIRPVDGEQRFKIVGLVGDRLYTGVFVWRDDRRRFISVRRSNTGERRAYSTSI
ncbi:BrnT family toxin [Salinisphaera orenii]|uniref:BrnT family toxin n=1 Tax=Salinisphaera orenii TaxID=856731 RepID=UPI000DBE6711